MVGLIRRAGASWSLLFPSMPSMPSMSVLVRGLDTQGPKVDAVVGACFNIFFLEKREQTRGTQERNEATRLNLARLAFFYYGRIKQ